MDRDVSYGSLLLQKQYSSKIGEGFLVIMKDSNRVTPSNLDPTKGYIQITYVEPYFESFDLQDRMTSYDRTVNVRKLQSSCHLSWIQSPFPYTYLSLLR